MSKDKTSPERGPEVQIHDDVESAVTHLFDQLEAAAGQARNVCPSCGSRRTTPIVYGEPDFELIEAAGRDEASIGGCCISDKSPSHECRDCGATWGRALNDNE